jgi:hypothetical protein
MQLLHGFVKVAAHGAAFRSNHLALEVQKQGHENARLSAGVSSRVQHAVHSRRVVVARGPFAAWRAQAGACAAPQSRYHANFGKTPVMRRGW